MQSGIDCRLTFRRLVIVRSRPLPNGPASQKLIETFQQAGGIFAQPSVHDLRTLWAVQRLLAEKDPHLNDWLLSRRPVTQLPLLRDLVPALAANPVAVSCQPAGPQPRDLACPEIAVPSIQDASPPQAPPEPVLRPPAPPVAPQPGDQCVPRLVEAAATANAPRHPQLELPLGRKIPGDSPLTMPLVLLDKHTVILAGAGSGKTVLLRRLVEEAAILGTPAIVIDCANDLSSLGQARPQTPESWTADDHAKAQQYHANTEVVVWTPGCGNGNPLVLDPIPDFAAMAADNDELTAAINMTCESLRPILAPGKGEIAEKKGGILLAALRYFAKQGFRTLEDLAALLSDLPPEAGLGLQKEAQLACNIAGLLKVHMAKDPLLQTRGAALDPALLFGDVPGGDKVRISVISLIGLPALEMQRKFLNQLAMTLFAWIKKHPAPQGRPLRGLLAIDEAKDFVPSVGNTACKDSLKQLTAQARKYGLGLIYATQHPKDIDNALVNNCATHFYGSVNAPAAIDTIKGLIHQKNGHGADIAMLPKGRFYVHNSDAGMKAPQKVQVPLCLSYHRPPLDAYEIATLAQKGRQQVFSRGASGMPPLDMGDQTAESQLEHAPA